MSNTTTQPAFAAPAGSALFIPLRKEYFEAFADGRKQWEYRRLGKRWNANTCPIGRSVVLSLGYGKTRRLTGRVTDFMVVQHPDCLPGWLACYGADAGHAACIRIELDQSPNAEVSEVAVADPTKTSGVRPPLSLD